MKLTIRHLKTISLLGLIFCLAACGSRRRAIEIEPDQGANKKPPIGIADEKPADTANITASITQEKFKDFLDFTKPVAYEFSYFSIESKDVLSFTAGKAVIYVAQLQVGVAGEMKLTLLQDGVAVLRAIKPGQVLTAGQQEIPFTFKPVDDETPPKPDPTKPDPAKPDPTEPDPAKPDPTEPDPAKPDPTEPDPEAEVTIEVTIAED